MIVLLGFMDILFWLPAASLFLAFFVSFAFAVYEKESLAMWRSLLLMILLPAPFAILYFLNIEIKNTLIIIIDSLLLLLTIVIFFPGFNSKKIKIDNPIARFDERDVIFKRRSLSKERKEEYYKRNPDKFEADKAWQAQPGLLSDKSYYYDKLQFTATDANFVASEHLGGLVNKMSPSEKKSDIPADELTKFIKKYADTIGAYDIGICELKDYHLYSNSGQEETYGQDIVNKHRYAIAIAVEMDKDMMDYAPAGPTVMETSNKYFVVGGIAVRIAQFLNMLGYDSKAHIDEFYEVLCPLVAQDANLGEIGRMGLLIHHELGPRHRLAVVTTDAPFIPDVKKIDYSVIDFCSFCKKCADVCPSQSISKNDREEDENGVLRWRINAEQCFEFWCKTGTDCGRCVQSCPYSHPHNLFHNTIRKTIKYFPVFRRFAYLMDDVFYGRVPKSKKVENSFYNKYL